MAERSLLVADLFCGAGGSSTGARRALGAAGYGMTLVAVNHATGLDHDRLLSEARGAVETAEFGPSLFKGGLL